MFRRNTNSVSDAIKSMKRHFEQLEQRQAFSAKETLSKLVKDISDVVTLLFGDEQTPQKSTDVTALMPKLLDASDDLFYKLAKHRTAFDHLVQKQIADILTFLIKFGGTKYAIDDYVRNKQTSDGHNRLIDALLNGYRFEEQHTEALFTIFQAMTKRRDLAFMLLHTKVTQPVKKGKQPRPKTRRQSAQQVPAFDDHYRCMHYRTNLTEPMACPNIAEIESGLDSLDLDVDDHKLQLASHSKPLPTLDSSKNNDVSFVDCLFELIDWPSLQVQIHAFKTLRCLLVTDDETLDRAQHNRMIDAYFQSHEHKLLTRFDALIGSDNTVSKKKGLELLSEILRKPQNIECLLQYVTQPRNLVVARRILSDAFVVSHTDDKQHNLLIDLLLERYLETAGDVLQELASRRKLAELLLNRTKITPFVCHDRINSERKSDGDMSVDVVDVEQHDLVVGLLLLIKRSSCDAVADYAYRTLCGLLTTHKTAAAQYLQQRYDALMTEIRAILQLENVESTRRNLVLCLLSTLLSPPERNTAFVQLFTSQVVNLEITMNLLNSKCVTTVDAALAIFYVFVSNAQLSSQRGIHVVLWRNINCKQRNLIGFIRNLLLNHKDTDTSQTQTRRQKKVDIIKCLFNIKLAKPHSDESCEQLPNLG